MKNKLEYLTKMSLDRKIKSKWFKIANILLAVLIIAVFNIDSIITFFGGDFNEKTKLYIIDHTNMSYDILKEQLTTIDTTYTGKEVSYEFILSDKTYEEEVESMKKTPRSQPKQIKIVQKIYYEDLELNGYRLWRNLFLFCK